MTYKGFQATRHQDHDGVFARVFDLELYWTGKRRVVCNLDEVGWEAVSEIIMVLYNVYLREYEEEENLIPKINVLILAPPSFN